MTNSNAYMKEYMKRRYKQRRSFIINFLGGICTQCGKIDVPFDVDHINPQTKQYAISKIWNYTLPKLISELEKCQLLCEPCHKKKNKIDVGETKHGDLAMYSRYKCRCDECRKSWNKWNREYKHRKRTLGRSVHTPAF